MARAIATGVEDGRRDVAGFDLLHDPARDWKWRRPGAREPGRDLPADNEGTAAPVRAVRGDAQVDGRAAEHR